MADVEDPAQAALFDEDEAAAAGREAVERVGENADPQWMARALDAVRKVARRRPTFTTDDVWAVLYQYDAVPDEPRAMGAVMIRARALGIVSRTDNYRNSARRRCHGRPVRVWISELPDAHTPAEPARTGS